MLLKFQHNRRCG